MKLNVNLPNHMVKQFIMGLNRNINKAIKTGVIIIESFDDFDTILNYIRESKCYFSGTTFTLEHAYFSGVNAGNQDLLDFSAFDLKHAQNITHFYNTANKPEYREKVLSWIASYFDPIVKRIESDLLNIDNADIESFEKLHTFDYSLVIKNGDWGFFKKYLTYVNSKVFRESFSIPQEKQSELETERRRFGGRKTAATRKYNKQNGIAPKKHINIDKKKKEKERIRQRLLEAERAKKEQQEKREKFLATLPEAWRIYETTDSWEYAFAELKKSSIQDVVTMWNDWSEMKNRISYLLNDLPVSLLEPIADSVVTYTFKNRPHIMRRTDAKRFIAFLTPVNALKTLAAFCDSGCYTGAFTKDELESYLMTYSMIKCTDVEIRYIDEVEIAYMISRIDEKLKEYEDNGVTFDDYQNVVTDDMEFISISLSNRLIDILKEYIDKGLTFEQCVVFARLFVENYSYQTNINRVKLVSKAFNLIWNKK